MASPVWTLCVFICVIIALIFCINVNPRFRIPFTQKHFTFTYIYPPIVGVVVLLITLQLSPMEAITAGIVGDSKLQPYAILILVLGMSVLCTALDFTGSLSFMAFHMVSRFVRTKLRLFTLMFILSALFGAVSSSHSVVMAVTPLIMYITQFAQISAIPYLFSGFYAANLSSLFFLIGNPTNIILASPFDVKFLEFFKYMILPAILTLLAGYFALLLKFSADLGVSMKEVVCCTAPQVVDNDSQQQQQQQYVDNDSPLQQHHHQQQRQPQKEEGEDQQGESEQSAPDGDGSNGVHLIKDDQSSQQLGMAGFNHASFQPTLAVEESYTQIASPPPDPTRLVLPDLDPSSELKDRLGAMLQTVFLTITLCAMAVSSLFSSVQLWHIALPGAVCSLLYCAIAYPFWPSSNRKKALSKRRLVAKPVHDLSSNGSQDGVIVEAIDLDGTATTTTGHNQHTDIITHNDIVMGSEVQARPQPDVPDNADHQPVVSTADLVEPVDNEDDTTVGDFAHRELCTWNILMQLPFDVLGFLIAMFILVQSLVKTGWVAEFAAACISLCGGNRIAFEYFDTVWGRCLIIIIIFSLFSLVLSNLMSAQPAAIFIVRMLIEINEAISQTQRDRDLFPDPVPGLNPHYQTAMMYTVIAASNYAGCLSIIGSISGIIFAKVVNQKVEKSKLEYLKLLQKDPQKAAQLKFHDDRISYTRFASKGLFTLPIIMGSCALGLLIISFY